MSRRGWLLFAAVGVLWGTPYFFIRVAVEEVEPIVVAFARVTIGGLLLLPFVLGKGRLSAVARHWKPALAFAALEILGPWLLLADAGTRLPSSLSGLLIASTPVLGFIISVASRHEPVGSWWRAVGLGLGLAGIALLSATEIRGGSPIGVAEVLVTAVGYATAPLIASKYLGEVSPLALTASCLLLATVVYAPFALPRLPGSVSGEVLGSLLALGVVCTAITFVLFLQLIAEVGPSRAVVIAFVNPIVALLLGVLVLSEPFTALIATGTAMVIVGSWLSTRSGARTSVDEAQAVTH